MEYDNFIRSYDNVFPKDYCDAVVQYFEDMDNAGFCQTKNDAKTKRDDTQLFVSDADVIKLTASATVSNYFFKNFPTVMQEYVDEYDYIKQLGELKIFNMKIQRTKIGQGFHTWHCERASKETTNRLLAFTLYLNDVDEGGETEFLYYPIRVKPKVGTVSIFPAGFTHLHRGNPPLSNTKYILTSWVEF